ncbi:MAG: four helix bundle protein [Saprospiraceae bacterium]|nr:four helix bundle protein [Saprospiraceae bacterium]
MNEFTQEDWSLNIVEEPGVPYSDLKERTKQFALNIVKYVQSLPSNTVGYRIGDQLLKSGTSVGANTRASFRARSRKEYVAKLGIVIEEADESIFWLEILESSGIANLEETKKLKQEAEELTKIFVSIYQKYKV